MVAVFLLVFGLSVQTIDSTNSAAKLCIDTNEQSSHCQNFLVKSEIKDVKELGY